MADAFYITGPSKVYRGPPGPPGAPGAPGAPGPDGPTGSGSIAHVSNLIQGDGSGAGVDSTILPANVIALVASTSGTNTGDQTNISGNAATVTTNANMTGDVTSLGNVTTLANVPVDAVHADDPTVRNLNEGGWSKYEVSSNQSYSGDTLQDIPGLVSAPLAVSARYEIEAKLMFSLSADTTGMKIAIHGGGGGSAATVLALVSATSNTATTVTSLILGTIDTATYALLNTSSVLGIVTMRGFCTTRSDPSATISIQDLKVTSGTVTCLRGSVMRLRKCEF